MILWQVEQLPLDLTNSPVSEDYHYIANDKEIEDDDDSILIIA